MTSWSPASWQSFPIKQQPTYADQNQLAMALDEIKAMPPLVFAGEINTLKNNLAQASKGEMFVLQGGDCAERFQDCNEAAITNKLKILLQMSVVLCYGVRKPVVRIGRIGGQYAKPRSNDFEEVDGKKLPVYRGDIINSYAPDPEGRKPDPDRLVESYYRSALTLNYIRSLTTGGFADLHYPDKWDLKFFNQAPSRDRYEKIVTNIRDAIAFMESLGSQNKSLSSVDFYTSHEGLILGYEESQTHFVEEFNGYYNLGAHMLWIGDRTRQLDGAHIEYFRGIANPIGIKVGPSTDPRELLQVIKTLNPKNEAGRLVLISRFGHQKVKNLFPAIAKAVHDSPHNVVWSVDPMHGNAIKTEDGVKTRDFDAILSELRDTYQIHQQLGSVLGGVHFELTGDDVTECTGGAAGITPQDLDRNYETYCDPRLNYSQSLEMAFLISSMLGQ